MADQTPNPKPEQPESAEPQARHDAERTPAQQDPLAKHLPVSPQAARYMSAGVQLVSVVGGMALLGYWVDIWTGSKKHWFLLGGAILGIITGLVTLIRTYLKS